MSYVVVVFRSRNETNRFHAQLLQEGIKAQIINTPKEASLSCGISVKLSLTNRVIAEKILKRHAYPSFVNFFEFYGI